jgi:type I restriction enzyme S subunit
LSTIEAASQRMEAALRARLSVERSMRSRMFHATGGRTQLLRDLLREPLRNGYSPVADPIGTVRVLTLSAVTYDAFVEANTKRALLHPRMAGLWLQPGDVLVERANTREFVGTAALYRGNPDWATYSDLMIRVRPDPSLMSPELLSEYLHLPEVRAYFRQRARGTSGSMPKIDHEIVANLPVVVPALSEQLRMTRVFRAVQTARSSARAELGCATDLFNSAIRQLMDPTP